MLMTLALSRTANVPFECAFGMADTLVVPAGAGASAVGRIMGWTNPEGKDVDLLGVGTREDLSACVVLGAVAVFAWFKILTAPGREVKKE